MTYCWLNAYSQKRRGRAQQYSLSDIRIATSSRYRLGVGFQSSGMSRRRSRRSCKGESVVLVTRDVSLSLSQFSPRMSARMHSTRRCLWRTVDWILYGLPISAQSQQYMQNILANSAVNAWVVQAQAERQFVQNQEPYRQHGEQFIRG